MKKTLSIFALFLIASVVMVGCAKKADTSKSVDQIRQEVETMSVAELESTARAYAKEIAGQKTELEKVKSKLKGLSPKDLLGEKAGSIKEEVSNVTGQISELTKRYKIYADKFVKSGGDVSKIKIS